MIDTAEQRALGRWLWGSAAVLVGAVLLVLGSRTAQVRSLTDRIAGAGGRVSVRSRLAPWLRDALPSRFLAVADEVVAVDLGGSPLPGPQLRRLLEDVRTFENLKRLHLNGTRLSGDTLQVVGRLPSLEFLDLSNTPVTDADLAHLQGLRNLENLALTRTRISDEGLRHVARLRRLESLLLDGTAVTDDGLQELRGLQHLSTLHLSNTAVTGDGLRRLAPALPKLEVYDD